MKRKEIENNSVNKMIIRDIEQLINDQTIDNLEVSLKELEKEKIAEIDAYAKENHISLNPAVIQQEFLKPLVPFRGKIPQYSAEKLELVYEYYCRVVAELNKSTIFYPSLASFCRLAGITTQTLREYRVSTDFSMRNVANAIYDEIGDLNIAMAQGGMAKSPATVFKLKTQNEMVEKSQPIVNVGIKANVDLNKISENLNKYKSIIDEG